MKINLPDDVLAYVERIFTQCNLAVSKKVSKMLNVYETNLDQTFIDQISNHAVPVTLGSGWTVRLDTHFLGGGRHFRSWEIADIGFLVMFTKSGKLVRSKVALLQSKRLYPIEVDRCDEDNLHNYVVGFRRLFESDNSYLSVSSPRKFTFNQISRYQALQRTTINIDISKSTRKNMVFLSIICYITRCVFRPLATFLGQQHETLEVPTRWVVA